MQPKPAPPKVYSTDPRSFRDLVQELTGTAPTAAAAPPADAAAAPAVGSSSLARPVNKRLQKIAPPPLNSSFSFCRVSQQQALPLSPLPSPTRQKPTSLSFSNHSPLSKILSPLPNLSPHGLQSFGVSASGDGVWANPLDSPYTAAIRQLAQKMVEGENASPKNELCSDPPSGFPWSPSFQSCLGLFSPGLFPGHGFGNIQNSLGINDSP
ncbi:hypothetical protein O6H91_03G037400 [Diphasiastrum complanatum]|nr:hypothetical protein O6H91_03G037400 [Diphasiastrum complanatum]